MVFEDGETATEPDSLLASNLSVTVERLPRQRFALVDGAHFSDLPKILKRKRLFARSLFLDSANTEVEKAGPWLVALDQSPEALKLVMGLVGTRPTAVFWSCSGGEAVLYRHLRTLNLARIPAGAIDATAPTDPDATGIVMLRHWDPRVISAVLPALNAEQFARFCGPAEEVAFVRDETRVGRIVKDAAWPPPKPGLLRIGEEQISALTEHRSTVARRKIAGYLREVAPTQTAHMSDEDLARRILSAERSGDALGLATERAHGKWAYLNLAYAEDARALARFRAFIAEDAERPECQLGRLYTSLIVSAARQEAAR